MSAKSRARQDMNRKAEYDSKKQPTIIDYRKFKAMFPDIPDGDQIANPNDEQSMKNYISKLQKFIDIETNGKGLSNNMIFINQKGETMASLNSS